MAIECIILDFDGTFTEVDREAAPFLEAYRVGLQRIIGEPIDALWKAAVATVRADPDAHGFEFGGRIVAPSHADPYILATSVAHLVLADLGSLAGPERAHALEGLFRESYAKCDTVFRPDALEVVEAVLAHGAPVYVVTNSHTEQVGEKLRALCARLKAPAGLERIKVHGNARKFHLVDAEPMDARFDAIPESMAVEGLGRPMYLRRGRYYDVLRHIFEETGATPSSTIVCGDIFELDLALPAQLGAAVHLVARESTPAYERAVVEAAGGAWSMTLRGFLTSLER